MKVITLEPAAPVMRVAMDAFARDGVLTTRASGAAARRSVEAELADRPAGLAFDFGRVRAISVPFAEALFVALTERRRLDHIATWTLCASHASDDVAQTLAAALLLHDSLLVHWGDSGMRLLGGDKRTAEVAAYGAGRPDFTTYDVAHALGVTHTGASKWITSLERRGGLRRTRVAIHRGGREYRYCLPRRYPHPGHHRVSAHLRSSAPSNIERAATATAPAA